MSKLKIGIPVPAIVSAQDYQKFQQIKQKHEKDFVLLDQIRSSFADQTPEQIQKGVEESVAEIRNKRKP